MTHICGISYDFSNGATGNNGSEIVKRLAAQNVPVRAMVRDRNRASAVIAPKVEVVEADFDRLKTLLTALSSVDRAFVTNSSELSFDKRKTQRIEQKHLRLRTRIKRLARKTICFSKTEEMHDLIIGLFIKSRSLA